jgi:hypothetical protein
MSARQHFVQSIQRVPCPPRTSSSLFSSMPELACILAINAPTPKRYAGCATGAVTVKPAAARAEICPWNVYFALGAVSVGTATEQGAL